MSDDSTSQLSYHHPIDAQWYIKVNESRVGPYSTSQIEGLLQDGELKPGAEITAAHLFDHDRQEEIWISIESMLKDKSRAEAASSEDSLQPLSVSTQGHGDETKLASDDSIKDLFNSLQAAKESAYRNSLPSEEAELDQHFIEKARHWFEANRQAVWMTMTALALFSLWWIWPSSSEPEPPPPTPEPPVAVETPSPQPTVQRIQPMPRRPMPVTVQPPKRAAPMRVTPPRRMAPPPRRAPMAQPTPQKKPPPPEPIDREEPDLEPLEEDPNYIYEDEPLPVDLDTLSAEEEDYLDEMDAPVEDEDGY